MLQSSINILFNLLNLSLPNLQIPRSPTKMVDRPEHLYKSVCDSCWRQGQQHQETWGLGMSGGRIFTGSLGLHTALSCVTLMWTRLKGGCGIHRNLIRPTSVLIRAVSKIIQRSSVRSTTSLGSLVMGFNETKYVSKKPLQLESTLHKNALCQNSALDLSGLTHSDSFFGFPIVLL